MGKGNQIICNRDGEHVETFFFEPYGDFDLEKKAMLEDKRDELAEEMSGLPFGERRRMLWQMVQDGRYPVSVRDEDVYDRQNENCRDEIDIIAYQVGTLDGFEAVRERDRESEAILVAGSREYGQVIARSDNCEVVIGDNESDVAIGCIPATTRDLSDEKVRDEEYDLLREEAEAELEKTRKRADANYEITDADIDRLADEKLWSLQEKVWGEIIAKYKKDANAAMRTIHEYFGTQSIRVRTGPWTSGELKPFNELTDEEKEAYY